VVQADFAIFSAGCVTVPVYPTYPPDLIAYVVNDSEAKTLIVEMRSSSPRLSSARQDAGARADCRCHGLRRAAAPKTVMTWETLRRRGRDGEAAHKSTLRSGWRRRAPRTWRRSSTRRARRTAEGRHADPRQPHRRRSASKQATPVAEVGSTSSFSRSPTRSPPRVVTWAWPTADHAFAETSKGWRELRRRAHIHLQRPARLREGVRKDPGGGRGGSPVKQKIFRWALGVGREVSRYQQRGQPRRPGSSSGAGSPTRSSLKLHAALGGPPVGGLGRARSRATSPSSSTPPDPALEGLWAHRDLPALTFNRRDKYKFGSVGQALPGVELNDRPDGEILAAGPTSPRAATSSSPTRRRGLRGGRLVPHGRHRPARRGRLLFINRRKKDLIVTAGGMTSRRETSRTCSRRPVHQPGDGLRRPPAVPGGAHHGDPEELRSSRAGTGSSSRMRACSSKKSTPRSVERWGAPSRRRTRSSSPTQKIKRFAGAARGLLARRRRAHADAEGEAQGGHQQDMSALEELYR